MVKDKIKEEIRHYKRKKEQDEAVIYSTSFGATVLAMLSIFSLAKKEHFSFGMLFTTFVSCVILLIKYTLHLNFINAELDELEDWVKSEEEDDFWFDEDEEEL